MTQIHIDNEYRVSVDVPGRRPSDGQLLSFAAGTSSPGATRPSSRSGRGPWTCGDIGGAEGTRTPDPLVANSGHGGRQSVSEHGSGRSKTRKPCRSQWRCCTSLLYFSAVRTERSDCHEPVTYFITSMSQAVHRGPRDLGPAWWWAKRFGVVRSDPVCG
jgi:hypothetical protein